MTNHLKPCGGNTPTEFIVIDHQDYVEDKLIALCDDLKNAGVETIEIASGLIFTLHNLLCQHNSDEAQKHYHFLMKQCAQHIEAMQEYYTAEKLE